MRNQPLKIKKKKDANLYVNKFENLDGMNNFQRKHSL